MNSVKLIHLKHNVEREIKASVEVVLRHAGENKIYGNLLPKFKAAINRRMRSINMQVKAETQDAYNIGCSFKTKKDGFICDIGLMAVEAADDDPVYDSDGNFRGIDEHGLQGEAIIYDGEFTNGMSRAKILANGGKRFSKLSNYKRWKFMDKGWEHWQCLPERPDWDGFPTIKESVAWAKAHPNALEKPTPDNMLYINSAKLDFGNIPTSRFDKLNEVTPINLFNVGNVAASITNPRLRATVYALGRVNMQLIDKDSKKVKIVNDEATDYDWNRGGRFLRDKLILEERIRHEMNDSHGFKVFYYGIGILNQ